MSDRRDGLRDDAERTPEGRRTQSDDGGWWGSNGPTGDDDPVVAAVSLLVLGLGLGSLFGFVPIEPFWMVFVIGFAVVVPLVSLLRTYQRGEAQTESGTDRTSERADEVSEDDGEFDDALARIRDRYARGELSDEQFERKLELLLETETPENARERVRRVREERAEREARTEREFES